MKAVNGCSPEIKSDEEIFIHRSKWEKDFTVIPNAIIRAKLSLAAKGLLLHLLALPRNWRIHCDQIMSETGTGQRPFWRYWNELKHTGFIVVRRTRSPDGKGFGSPISTFTTSQR